MPQPLNTPSRNAPPFPPVGILLAKRWSRRSVADTIHPPPRDTHPPRANQPSHELASAIRRRRYSPVNSNPVFAAYVNNLSSYCHQHSADDDHDRHMCQFLPPGVWCFLLVVFDNVAPPRTPKSHRLCLRAFRARSIYASVLRWRSITDATRALLSRTGSSGEPFLSPHFAPRHRQRWHYHISLS